MGVLSVHRHTLMELRLVLLSNMSLPVITLALGFIFGEVIFDISIPFALLGMLSGVLVVVSIIPYFYAIKENDVSLVVPFFQIVPIFAFIAGYLFFGESILLVQIIGGGCLMVGSIGLTYEKVEGLHKFNSYPLLLMILTCIMTIGADITFKIVMSATGYKQAMFWQDFGGMFFIVIYFCIPSVNYSILKIIKEHRVGVILVSSANAFLNISGKMILNYTISIVPLFLAILTTSFEPFFTFMVGLILTVLLKNSIIKEDISGKALYQKSVFLIIIFIGSLLIN